MPLPEVLRLAEVERIAGRIEAAAGLLARAEAVAPDHPGLAQAQSLIAFQQGDFARAMALSAAAVRADPDRPGWWRNRCTIAERAGDYAVALEAAGRAAALAPEDADLWHALAVVRYRLEQPAEAEAAARAALRLDSTHAGAHVILAETLLQRGDFAAAWPHYEHRFRLRGVPPVAPALGCPVWDGAPLAGRLLVVADQGYGDAIQFARYLPWAAGSAGALSLLAPPELAPLLAPLVPGAALRAGWEEVAADCPNLAAWIPLSGLPRCAGTRPATIPAAPGGYLRAEPGAVARWRARLAALAPGEGRVGLVWAGRASHPNDASRSAPAAALAPLAAVPGVALFGLQHGPAAADWAALGPPERALGAGIADFPTLAAAVAALDLLISVDSAPAHLAGALGVPAWVMLPLGPDWRWGLERTDSPWYPGMRLFRMRRPRDWAATAAAVAAALRDQAPISARTCAAEAAASASRS
ncbi:MAG: glycosyltransferase [Acetobacteraceae bacterium]